MKSREEILSKIGDIPSLPPTAVNAVRLLRDDNSSMEQIVAIVEYDPGLTANLLRLCNSAQVGGRGEVTSLRAAIVRLGARQTLNLILSDAVGSFARQPIRGYDLSQGELWKHSVAVAAGTEALAKTLGLDPDPCTFTAALLHDLGKIVMGTFVAVDAQPIVDLAYKKGLRFEKAEREILDIDHAEAGAALLAAWNLPETVIDIVRWHHEPNNVTGDTLSVDLVHAADLLAMESGIGAGIDGINYSLSPEIAARLRVNNRVVEKVLMHVVSELEEVQDLFGAASGG